MTIRDAVDRAIRAGATTLPNAEREYVREITDGVIRKMYEARKSLPCFHDEAINWGHLEVVSVEPAEWEILIEEAAPGSTEFQDEVARRLATRGIRAVVKTEW